MNMKDWSFLLACSFFWGGSFFFVEVALRGLPPFTLVFLRVCIAALALIVAAPLLGIKLPRSKTILLAFLFLGLTNNAIPFSLITYGQTQIASGLASIFNATMPIWTVIIAHFWTADEKLTLNRVIGVLLGLIGVGVMMGPELISNAFGTIGSTFLGQLAILGATFSYGIAAVFARRFKAWGVPPMAIATGQLCASSLMLLPIMVIHDQPWTLAMPGLDVWGAVFGIALLSSALTYYLYFKFLDSAGATNVSLVTLLAPVSAVLLGVFVLGETLEIKHMIGMAIIAFGLLAIDGRLLPKKRPLAPP
ncbi:MAG: DMT family transporter [Rhodospirillaceae bacterium]|nr:DMT family transporter [Rhodospirillaceae bacterium]MBT4589599.1 DMT family transporter [Rhodospirillaceae bacterium]MBT7266871.1 DMT family transporter [Rhodospirillaceae bacterium]